MFSVSVTYYTAFLIFCLTAIITSTEPLSCKKLVSCPCGETGMNIRVCEENTARKDTCSKWSNCKKCQHGLLRCLECEKGFEGPFCISNTTKRLNSRQKRQYPTYQRQQSQRNHGVRVYPDSQRSPRYRNYYYNDYNWYTYTLNSGECSDLQSPTSGSIRCHYSIRRTSCTGNCLPGYVFENTEETEMTLTCKNGIWTPYEEFPPCKSRGYCNLELQGYQYGSFNCTTGMDGTYCNIICGSRYSRHHCTPKRSWRPRLPNCVRPKAVPSKLTCSDPGFIQDAIRTDPHGAESTFKRTFDEGESVVFQCRTEKYALRGFPYLTCNNGSWSQDLPKCIKIIVTPVITCSDPGQVVNADRLDRTLSVDKQKFSVGESVEYICHDGFYLRRQSVITCTSSGTWSHPRPYCRRISITTTTENPIVLCPDPGQIANSYRVKVDGSPAEGVKSYEVGQSVMYICHDGYELQGGNTVTCLWTGVWSHSFTYCHPRHTITTTTRAPFNAVCGNPGNIQNGRVVYYRSIISRTGIPGPLLDYEYPEGAKMEYFCDPGYTLEGSDTIKCEASGDWSAATPTCKRDPFNAVCGNPGNIQNGRVVYYRSIISRTGIPGPLQDYEYPEGAKMEYFCDPGYTLEGSNTIKCEASGDWSAATPTCKRDPVNIVCGNPGNIQNGRVVYYRSIISRTGIPGPLRDLEYPEGAKMEYFCDPGYTLEGSDTIKCEASGDWSVATPTCKREPANIVRSCRSPGNIENGRVVYYRSIISRTGIPGPLRDLEYPEGAKMEYFCDPGYTLEGSDTIQCEASGEWSSATPTCREDNGIKYCRNPGNMENGKAIYYPDLSIRRGSPASSDVPAYPQGSRLRFSCDDGYTLQGLFNIICEESGEWSAPKPFCKLGTNNEFCLNPGSVMNGRLSYYPDVNSGISYDSLDDPEYPEGSRIQYFCNPGYRLQGSPAIECEENGEWSDIKPTCIRESNNQKYCHNPGTIQYGQVKLLDERRGLISLPNNQLFPEGTILEYTCNISYILDGESSVTCEFSGTWSAKPPTCLTISGKELMYCDNPGLISNARRIAYSTLIGAKIGASESDADMEEEDEYPEGTRLKYSCEPGYKLKGDEEFVCQSTGFWLPKEFPYCFEDCGHSYVQSGPKIVNGSKTVVGEWPWVVAIALRENNYSQIICGGTVLNSRTVITAAHCLATDVTYTLYFGKQFLEDNYDDDKVFTRSSIKVIIHPDYNSTTYDSDIALITFEQIEYSPRVQPICLPNHETTALNIMTGNEGYVTGWGLTERRLQSSELLLAKLPVVSTRACIESFRRTNSNFKLTRNMFCAGYMNGMQSACIGDSGGSLVFMYKDRYRLEGLVSFGAIGQCGLPGKYTVFTKVYEFRLWIYKIENELD